MPLLAPSLGIIAAILINVIWVKSDQKLDRLLILFIISGIGFLVGFLPFEYFIQF
jgi:hypothetical protein